MVIHQLAGMQDNLESPNHSSQQSYEVKPIPVIPGNGFPFIAASGDMIPSPGSLASQRPAHGPHCIGIIAPVNSSQVQSPPYLSNVQM
jgi:hypothetical protein